jgi:hypothetical protein
MPSQEHSMVFNGSHAIFQGKNRFHGPLFGVYKQAF